MTDDESMDWAEELVHEVTRVLVELIGDNPTLVRMLRATMLYSIRSALAKAVETVRENIECIGEPFSECGVGKALAALQALGAAECEHEPEEKMSATICRKCRKVLREK